MKHEPTFDDNAVANFVGYFAERLNLVFSYHFCVFEFEDDADFAADDFQNARAWCLQTLREACLHTTLIAVRDLDDVLAVRTAKTKPDDFRISDLGFPHSLRFLAQSERTAINKRIAHSTLPGAEPIIIRWDVFELVTKAVTQSLKFLDWVAEQQTLEQFESWTSALYCKTRTRKIYEGIADFVESRRKESAQNKIDSNQF